MATYPDTPATPRNLGDYNAPHTSPVTPMEDFRTVLLNRVSIGAVFSGVMFALVAQLILNMIGIGVGAVAVSDGGVAATPQGFSWMAALWWAASGILAAFAGGLAAGRLCGDPKETTGMWHGLIAWATSIIIIAALAVAGAGAQLSGGFSALPGMTSQQTISANAGLTAGQMTGQMTGQAGAMASVPVLTPPSATAGPGTAPEMTAPGTMGDTMTGTAETDMATGTSMGATPGTTTSGTMGSPATGTTMTATPAAEETVSALGKASLISAIALIIGALAAGFGGCAGSVKPTVTNSSIRKNLH